MHKILIFFEDTIAHDYNVKIITTTYRVCKLQRKRGYYL